MKRKRKNRFWRVFLYLFIGFALIIVGFVTWFHFDTKISPPEIRDKSALQLERLTIGANYYAIGNNWLRKNDFGLWEMYLEGSPFEMGVISGKLTKELIRKQEEAFVDQIKLLVPSESYLKFLKYFIAFFNRDIEDHILQEYKEEIYGISFSASEDFDYIGSNYERMLNYHGAHDIGHALQDLMLVGCTSFAANLGSADSSLIIGRNFDFYINEAFAEDKIVVFVNPDHGHKFSYITWASMIGVVSGMNNKGLTVTINAGKSEIPGKAATPISLLAREVLQYAENIEEAIAIAEKRKTFVSESLLIGSAADNKAVIIEKSPSKFGVFETDNIFMVCSNHFQSDVFSNDENNLKHIRETASAYRQERNEQLILSTDTINYEEAAAILRDRNGLDDISIGIGNEKAMAQMISHHSVIFKPLKRNMWVSTQVFQFGEYLGYRLGNIFNHPQVVNQQGLFDQTLTIAADDFLRTTAYSNYHLFKEKRALLLETIENKKQLDTEFLESFINLNPDYYQAYVLVGDYYTGIDSTEKAIQYYNKALTKEFENSPEREEAEQKISSLIDQ